MGEDLWDKFSTETTPETRPEVLDELVAEGIEHNDQLSRLQSMKCELGQGFLFAKPMEASFHAKR